LEERRPPLLRNTNQTMWCGELADRRRRKSRSDSRGGLLHTCLPRRFMVGPNSSGRGDLARGFYVENDLSSRQRSSAFQHHVGLSRIGEREDRTDACFQLTTINKLGNSAQPRGGYFHQEKGCIDAVVLCAVLIRLGHGGDQFASRAKNLKRTC
jgi:hypothetical protein